MNSKEVLKSLGYTAVAFAGIEFISRFAFSENSRLEILLRDGHCQVIDCNFPDKPTAHHIIPNSGLHRATDYASDIYTHPVKQALREIIDSLGSEGDVVWSYVRQFINSPANGIILCSTHHTQLHRGNVEELALLSHPNHHIRPPVLSVESALRFQEKLIDDLIRIHL